MIVAIYFLFFSVQKAKKTKKKQENGGKILKNMFAPRPWLKVLFPVLLRGKQDLYKIWFLQWHQPSCQIEPLQKEVLHQD